MNAMTEELAEPQDIAEIRDGTAIVRLSRTEAGLATLRADLAGRAYDLTTTKGDAAARADRLRCVTLRAATEKLRKALKAPALEFGRKIDAEAARITQAVLALEQPIDAAIKADEERRAEEKAARERAMAERLAGLRTQVDAIMSKWVQRCEADGMTSARIASGIHTLQAMEMPHDLADVLPYWQQQMAATVLRMTALGDQCARREETARMEAVRAEQERVAAEQRRQAEELARQRAEIEAQAQALRDEAERLQRERDAAVAAQPAPLLLQDESRGLTEALASKPDARMHAREAAAAIATEPMPQPGVAPLNHQIPEADAAPGMGTADEPASAPTLRLGQINDLLDPVRIDAAGLQRLGFAPAGTVRSAKLYHQADWPSIKAALVAHINALD